MRTPVALVHRFGQAFSEGATEAFDDVLADDVVDMQPVPLQGPGRVGVALKVAMFRAQYPGFTTRFTSIVGTGDVMHGDADATWVTTFPDGAVTRWRGWFHFRDGKIVAFGTSHVE